MGLVLTMQFVATAQIPVLRTQYAANNHIKTINWNKVMDILFLIIGCVLGFAALIFARKYANSPRVIASMSVIFFSFLITVQFLYPNIFSTGKLIFLCILSIIPIMEIVLKKYIYSKE
jgi:hypothetical protein